MDLTLLSLSIKVFEFELSLPLPLSLPLSVSVSLSSVCENVFLYVLLCNGVWIDFVDLPWEGV